MTALATIRANFAEIFWDQRPKQSKYGHKRIKTTRKTFQNSGVVSSSCFDIAALAWNYSAW